MKESIFRTTDLSLASYLRYSGVPLASEYDFRNKEWIFSDDERCRECSLMLTNGKALVNVLEYEMHRKNLLSLTKRSRNE